MRLLSPEGEEPAWPAADVVVGNPPFLGYSPQRETLGDGYTDALRRVYKGAIPAFADLVCYWFHKAGKSVTDNKIARAGLVATNSIRGGRNRVVLDQIVQDSVIFDAWSDEPWIVDGAAVRVSVICFGTERAGLVSRHLNGSEVSRINADLTATADITTATRLACNRRVAFIGGMKKGSFDIPGDLAREWLWLPTNPNGRTNADVLKPWMNGMDLTRRPAGKWIIDFGHGMSESEAALYEAAVRVRHEACEARTRAESARRLAAGLVAA